MSFFGNENMELLHSILIIILGEDQEKQDRNFLDKQTHF